MAIRLAHFQELEEDKVREENKKKKQAAKRRDKRKKKKKQKEPEQQNNMVNSEPQPSENRTTAENGEDDNTCSEDETSRMVTSDSHRLQPNSTSRDWNFETEIENRKNVNTCRTMTVGQAQDEKGNTNSTEERRDDQPQAMFDANDQQDQISPKKTEPLEKTSREVENNKKNKPASLSKRHSSSRFQGVNPERRVEVSESVMSDERFDVENGDCEGQCEAHVNERVKQRDEMVASSNNFIARANIKTLVQNDIVKDGWKPTGKKC